jgi:hypothetical protein
MGSHSASLNQSSVFFAMYNSVTSTFPQLGCQKIGILRQSACILFIYLASLFIYDVFNDTVSSSDHIASNDGTINE